MSPRSPVRYGGSEIDMTSRELPCLFARAGTSRGAFLLRSDLPADPDLLDQVILSVYGSPDPRQINGIGGGDALTSKVAVVAPSQRPDADVDYTFGQVSIDDPKVFWVGNCGNMSSGVGPFAIRQGLVSAETPLTRVRIFNTNTEKVLTAEVQVDDDGQVVESGEVEIAGVPGTGAPIMLDFGDCGGAVTGRTLPTGRTREEVTLTDGRSVAVSIVDAATPFVFVRAADLGMTGSEMPADIENNEPLRDALEEVRSYAARALGFVKPAEVAREVSPSIPRVVAVAAPADYVASDGSKVRSDEYTVLARQMAMQRPHKTYAVTGTLCTGVAGAIPGTVVHEVAAPSDDGRFHIGHPGGVISARVTVDRTSDPDDIRIVEASLLRTARTIMTGHLAVPTSVWSRDAPTYDTSVSA